MNAPFAKLTDDVCQCKPYRPCAACEAITDLEECSTCGEVAYSWPRCTACGTVDIGYLHSKVRGDWTVTVRENADGSWSAAA